MITLEDLTNGLHAVYEHLWSPSRYKFLGSSFTVAFDDRTFLVTAGHVIAEKKFNELRFLNSAGTLKCLPFKAKDLPESETMGDDLAILEIDATRLEHHEFLALGFLPLDRQKDREFTDLPRNAILLTKGYPSERGQVDYDRRVLTNRSFMTDGRYSRPMEEAPGINSVTYYKDDPPNVKSRDGMCGSPWIVGDCLDEEWVGMLAGIHVAGGASGEVDIMGFFIRAEVLIERLSKI